MIHLTDAIMMNRKRTEVKDVAEYTPCLLYTSDAADEL